MVPKNNENLSKNKGLVEKVEEIFKQFLREEIGNRLSQFSLKALKDIVLIEIVSHTEINKKAQIVNEEIAKRK